VNFNLIPNKTKKNQKETKQQQDTSKGINQIKTGKGSK